MIIITFVFEHLYSFRCVDCFILMFLDVIFSLFYMTVLDLGSCSCFPFSVSRGYISSSRFWTTGGDETIIIITIFIISGTETIINTTVNIVIIVCRIVIFSCISLVNNLWDFFRKISGMQVIWLNFVLSPDKNWRYFTRTFKNNKTKQKLWAIVLLKNCLIGVSTNP